MRKNSLFYKWVPGWLQVTVHILLFVPILFISGVYSPNASEMSSELGIIAEHIQYANFATAVGMAVIAPFFLRYMLMRRPKMMFVFGFNMLFLLSWVCAVTDSMFLLMCCSFITGSLRFMLIMNNLFPLLQRLTGHNPINGFLPQYAPTDPAVIARMDYGKAMMLPIVYVFFMTMGQVGSFVTAWLAYEYEWQYVYYAMMALALMSIMLVLVTMKYQKGNGLWVRFYKTGDFTAVSVFLLSVCYMLVYGKTLDWFDDVTMRIALIASFISLGMFLMVQRGSFRPYLRLGIFRRTYTHIAVLLFMLFMLVGSHSMLVNVYMGISMKTDNLQNASIGNYGIIGYVIAAFLCIVLAKRKVHFRYIFMTGFCFFMASAVYLYFHYQPQELYDNLILPTILRNIGTFMLYAMVAVYGMRRLPAVLIPSWIFVMLTFRSALGPAVGVSVYSNVLHHRQEQHVANLTEYADASNVDFLNNYKRTVMGGKMQGHSEETACQMAALSSKGKIQQQAMLVTLKEMTGWTIYLCLGCMLLVLVLPYPKDE